jgi:hypothetical protein
VCVNCLSFSLFEEESLTKKRARGVCMYSKTTTMSVWRETEGAHTHHTHHHTKKPIKFGGDDPLDDSFWRAGE